MPRLGASKKNRSMIIGLLCGIACAICVGIYIASVDEQANAAQAEMLAKYGGDQIEVCVAKRDIAAGETIRDSDMETRMWIAALLPADAITARGDAVGKQIGSTILAGEVISSKRFGLESSNIEVPDGFTAISVPAKDVQAVGGVLRSGMRCDVYATGASTTSRLASNALVLMTSATDDSAGSVATTWVTLAIEPSKVEEMVSAAQNLDLYFVLPSSENSDESSEAKPSIEEKSAKATDPSEKDEFATASSSGNEGNIDITKVADTDDVDVSE